MIIHAFSSSRERTDLVSLIKLTNFFTYKAKNCSDYNEINYLTFLSLALLLKSITLGVDGYRFSVIFVGQD